MVGAILEAYFDFFHRMLIRIFKVDVTSRPVLRIGIRLIGDLIALIVLILILIFVAFIVFLVRYYF